MDGPQEEIQKVRSKTFPFSMHEIIEEMRTHEATTNEGKNIFHNCKRLSYKSNKTSDILKATLINWLVALWLRTFETAPWPLVA